MFNKGRRRHQLGKVRPGNGSRLAPFKVWQLFNRTVFFIELGDERTDDHGIYAVDVRYLADEEEKPTKDAKANAKALRKNPPAALYRDGIQVARSSLPATFAVPEGVIEVAVSMYGLSRMHFVPDSGEAQTLQPHKRSPEGLRARFGMRYPKASRLVGFAAIVILIVGLIVGIPAGLEMLTQIEPIAERFGTFTSPIALPVWLNTTLLIVGIAAAVERALTLRNNWLIDFDTAWTSL
jgi:hypothetical protein